MDKIIVTIFGFLGIIFVYWFFLMKKSEEVKAENSVDITVNGGYSPEVISIPKDRTTKINFTRTDPTDCLSEVVLGDFKIRRELPLNQKVTVEITPTKSGEFDYSCGMGMYHGKIVVK
ncbi:MAG: cupredoxin domain-containing protein [Candidatus Daviesbacteria bacterium]|nr:cupredoxin domain-containing protein [Candidatus Daviesbacteria bacterium]